MIEEAEALAVNLRGPLAKAYRGLYATLADEIGCDVYVKTIYVGFSLGGQMVAAVYPHKDCMEVALALPEDIEGSEFKDATHLTWPTMPVCMEVRTADDLALALGHARDAGDRVRAGEHDVRRPNDHFIGRVQRLTRDPTRPEP